MADIKRAMEFVMQWEQEYEEPSRKIGDPFEMILCSLCLHDQGLRLVAERYGFKVDAPCPRCELMDGAKLDLKAVKLVMRSFFNLGTFLRWQFGGASLLVCNPRRPTSVAFPGWLQDDLRLLTETSGWGVFEYGPRMWMLGENEPLKALQDSEQRTAIVRRIVQEYPVRTISPEEHFYRMRLNLTSPEDTKQFDSPPLQLCGSGRLDSPDTPVLYASQDLEVCVHECRTTVEDDVFVATLRPTRALKLLDLTHILLEKCTEFESLDIAVHMLFLAKQHSYEITRAVSREIKLSGLDGVIYPSYFSLVRTGATPFETVLGMSVRRMGVENYAARQIIPNLALFGHPVREGIVEVQCINRVVLERMGYLLNFGPVGFKSIDLDTAVSS